MKKNKEYRLTCFTPEIIREAKVVFESISKEDKRLSSPTFSVTLKDVEWHHDSEEEFFADIRREDVKDYVVSQLLANYYLAIVYEFSTCHVTVGAPTRSEIEKVFDCFERGALSCKITTSSPLIDRSQEPKPVIFIGHGRNESWRDLKDHLHEQHGYDVQSYEIGARAGHAIRDILEHMLQTSSFAFLVMTAEDRDEGGQLKPRQNVVHELGLFQGKLGFGKAVVLLEEGIEEFSNIHGIHQIRFPRNHIKETYGDVLATLKREFGASDETQEEEK